MHDIECCSRMIGQSWPIDMLTYFFRKWGDIEMLSEKNVLEKTNVRKHWDLGRGRQAKVARQLSVVCPQLHVSFADDVLNFSCREFAVGGISERDNA